MVDLLSCVVVLYYAGSSISVPTCPYSGFRIQDSGFRIKEPKSPKEKAPLGALSK